MGMNLFPQFRGGEVRQVYAQLMRVLYHQLGARYFFLTPYGMGEDNEDALASGAFWFYRKLGFRPTNPEVEELAQAEEKCIAQQPGYRSDRRTLRRLSHTSAYLDLSRGRCRPLSFGRLAVRVTELAARQHGGDRRRTEKRSALRIARWLGCNSTGRALRNLAPLLDCIPDREQWSTRDRRTLLRFVGAKDAASEASASRLTTSQPRFVRALRRLVNED